MPVLRKIHLGEELKGIKDESFYIDFKNLTKDKIYKSLFEQPKPVLYVGWLFSSEYDKDFYEKKVFSSLYDGLFYIQKSSETTFIENKNAN